MTFFYFLMSVLKKSIYSLIYTLVHQNLPVDWIKIKLVVSRKRNMYRKSEKKKYMCDECCGIFSEKSGIN